MKLFSIYLFLQISHLSDTGGPSHKYYGNLLTAHPGGCGRSCNVFAYRWPDLILDNPVDWNIIIPILLMRKLRLSKMKWFIQACKAGILGLPFYFLKHVTPPSSSQCPDWKQYHLPRPLLQQHLLPAPASSLVPAHTSQIWPHRAPLKSVSGFSLPTDKVQTL